MYNQSLYRINHIYAQNDYVIYNIQNLNTYQVNNYLFYRNHLPKLMIGNVINANSLQLLLNRLGRQIVK